jgi:vacuolar-type H+-ATPase subunit E/Vma4
MMDTFESWITEAFEAAKRGELDKATTMRQIAQAGADYQTFQADVIERTVDAIDERVRALDVRVKGIESDSKFASAAWRDLSERVHSAQSDAVTAVALQKRSGQGVP